MVLFGKCCVNDSRHGTESPSVAGSTDSTNRVILSTLAGCTMKCNGTSPSVGCFLVCACINNLHSDLLFVFRPDGNIGRLAFLQMAVMPVVVKFGIVLPVTAYRAG